MKHILVIAALMATVAHAQVPVRVSSDHAHRVQIPRVPKIKLLRSNPHRFTAIRLQNTDPYDTPDDDFIHPGTVRRPKVIRTEPKLDDELSDYVTVRLAVARARAMEKYRQVHS